MLVSIEPSGRKGDMKPPRDWWRQMQPVTLVYVEGSTRRSAVAGSSIGNTSSMIPVTETTDVVTTNDTCKPTLGAPLPLKADVLHVHRAGMSSSCTHTWPSLSLKRVTMPVRNGDDMASKRGYSDTKHEHRQRLRAELRTTRRMNL